MTVAFVNEQGVFVDQQRQPEIDPSHPLFPDYLRALMHVRDVARRLFENLPRCDHQGCDQIASHGHVMGLGRRCQAHLIGESSRDWGKFPRAHDQQELEKGFETLDDLLLK